jgi:protein ImuB
MSPVTPGPRSALRRFRLPVPARVHVQDGRPVRVLTDRRGVTGGPVVQAAGPWRTSGEWWNDGQSGRSWDRDEWDVAIADGTVYRLYVERDIGQWFLDGVVD